LVFVSLPDTYILFYFYFLPEVGASGLVESRGRLLQANASGEKMIAQAFFLKQVCPGA